ncbi:MAG: NAD(P)/FAD-dependent oxidoreductase [Candidatus Omnitrophica bacterium]|nr:NAD(P)/FAD-dependent oxidoreductase [Candidatus Omnitrophota bacterium]
MAQQKQDITEHFIEKWQDNFDQRFVIVGGSVAAHTVAYKLREVFKDDIGIAILSQEKYPFYDRRKLFSFWEGKVKEKELFVLGQEDYQKRNIFFLPEHTVVSVNSKRKSVSFRYQEKRDTINYDYLVICSGTKTVLPNDIVGINKNGVFVFDSLADFKQLKNTITQDTVALLGVNHFTSLVIDILIKKRVEVKLITNQKVDFSSSMVEVIPTKVVEIIGESGVQAIKLDNGKIIGVCWIGVMGQKQPATDFLEDTGMALVNNAVVVDKDMATSEPYIFACGSVCCQPNEEVKFKDWRTTTQQAERLVETIRFLRRTNVN